jgi:hypothetical protein
MKNFDELYDAICEMALTDFKKIGKWDDKKSRHGYDKASVALLNSDAGVRKIQDTFNKVKLADFNLYFLKKPNAKNFAETGQVDSEFLQKNLGLTIGQDIKDPSENGEITIIFTNNTAAEKVPLTPWTIAHRIGHAFYATEQKKYRSSTIDSHIKYIDNILKDIFDSCYDYDILSKSYNRTILGNRDYILRDFLENIGTFRSARLKKLPRTFEFFFECFAQWLLSNGNLKFNDFPKVLKSSNRKAWGNDTGRYYRLIDEDLADNYKSDLTYAFENAFRKLLDSNFGKFSVM